MPESVTVEQGPVSVTTNTATEADLRAELDAPPVPESTAPSRPERDTPGDLPSPTRHPDGRFAKKADGSPPDPAAASAPPAETPARRRDDTLPRHSPIARMNQALAQKVEADRRAAEAERRAALLEATLAQSQAGAPASSGPPLGSPALSASPTAEPQFEQFATSADPYTAYLQAWSRWDRQQALSQARAEWTAEQQEQVAATQRAQRIAEGRTQYPDYDQKLAEAEQLGLQVSEVMRRAMDDSPQTADLVYYLATHPEECTQLAEESLAMPVAAAPVMRRLLEAKLQPSVSAPTPRAVSPLGSGAAARVTTSTAKPPVTPVGSSPVVSDDPPGEGASAAEHARYWNRRLKVPGSH